MRRLLAVMVSLSFLLVLPGCRDRKGAGGSVSPTRTDGSAGAEPEGRRSPAARSRGPDPTKRYRVYPVDPFPYYGERRGEVVVALFLDLGRDRCADLASTVGRLMKGEPGRRPGQLTVWAGYGTDGGVRVVLVHVPHSPEARLVHEAVAEAFSQKGGDGFLNMLTLVCAGSRPASLRDLETMAQRAGLDVPRFERALSSHAHAREVDAGLALARRLGMDSTPLVLVNGRVVRSMDFSSIKAMVTAELDIADEFMEAHEREMDESEYYATIMKSAWVPPKSR